ncbi:MAG: MBL fold metallo-hydrolase [Gammaproteobacteria bacterium]
MTITNKGSGTNVHEIADGIYRINTPVVFENGLGFSFNQYLVDDEQPLLFHTGPRKMFPLVREAVASIMPIARLRYIGFSHVEADECGSLNEWLAEAPDAVPLCGAVASLVSVNDLADRPARPLADGEVLSLGRHQVRWFDTPHLPHGWECGLLMEETTRTLFCGDLFTQDYFSHTTNAPAMLERLAATEPTTLACMHGSVYKGDGAAQLRGLASALSPQSAQHLKEIAN